jgi:alcohol dehydrogenase
VEHPGAFAEYLTLPERNLHFVPPEISDDEAVFTEPLAAACEILDQLPIGAGSKVAVLGDGKLGLLCSLVLRANGADVTLFGRHEHKLGIARKVGIEALDREDRRPAAFPVVVEATGSREGLRQAVSMARPRGAVVMKTTVHDPVEIDSAAVVVNEINLVGSRCGRFEPALHLLRTKQIDVLPLVSAEFRLSEAPEAFSMAARRGVLKVLLRNESARFQT